jgi:hypothetical protein
MSAIAADSRLPEGFDSLEKHVSKWAGYSTQERWNTRSSSSMQQIQAFYDDMLPHAERALAYLDTQSLSSLSSEADRLLRLLLSLSSCSMAVELHHQPRAPHSPFPHGVRVLRGGHPHG